MAKTYRDLIAWRKGMKLVLAVYRSTEKFPKHERFGLTQQIQRCAVSVPSNVAEGQARYSNPEFHRFLRVSRGSLVELETQLMIAHSLGYLPDAEERALLKQTSELGRILNGLTASVKKRSSTEAKSN
jgi:four helix bundle protein